MAEKRRGGRLSDSDDEISDAKKRRTLMYEENESNRNEEILGNENSVDSSNSFSNYSDYSLKLMVNNVLI